MASNKWLTANTVLVVLLAGIIIYWKSGEFKEAHKTISQVAATVPLDSHGKARDLTGSAAYSAYAAFSLEKVTFPAQSRPTLVYIFSPSCPACAANESNFATVYAQVKREYRVIGVSLSTQGLDAYIDRLGYDFPILVNISGWKPIATPQMVVVAADGRVQHDWIGIPPQVEMERAFNVKLPEKKDAHVSH